MRTVSEEERLCDNEDVLCDLKGMHGDDITITSSSGSDVALEAGEKKNYLCLLPSHSTSW